MQVNKCQNKCHNVNFCGVKVKVITTNRAGKVIDVAEKIARELRGKGINYAEYNIYAKHKFLAIRNIFTGGGFMVRGEKAQNIGDVQRCLNGYLASVKGLNR